MERLKIPGYSLRDILLGLYIVAIPFHRSVWRLPVFGERLQPSELALGILLLYFLYLVFSRRVTCWFSPFDVPALLWLLANVAINAAVGFGPHLLLETAKVVAVVLVYFVFRLLLHDDFLGKFADIMLFAALIASLLAIAGSLLSAFGVRTAWIAQMQTYPYIGAVGRAMAFTSTPNMLGSFLMTALLLKAAQRSSGKALKRGEVIAIAFCLLAFVAAVTKTILCFLLGLIVLALLTGKKKKPWFKAGAAVAALLLTLAYLVGSHFVFTPAVTPRVLDNMQQGHITRVVHNLGPLQAVETSYLTIKRSCLYEIKESFPWGIGTRNFKLAVPRLKELGVYNRETRPFDPHCTPLGTLTELGLPGGIVLVIFFAMLARGLWRLERNKTYPFHFLISGLIAIFAAVCLEAWVTDIMNFRHYWMLLAILAYMARSAASRAAVPAR
jgi:O-antigen ligase